MTTELLSRIQGVVLAVLAVIVATGTITPDLSRPIEGLSAAIITLIAAWRVRRPRDAT